MEAEQPAALPMLLKLDNFLLVSAPGGRSYPPENRDPKVEDDDGKVAPRCPVTKHKYAVFKVKQVCETGSDRIVGPEFG